ncbi:MAG: energy-coupling factor transporter transmembrane protein EcfT [Bacilli bacterium]|nr:energy-coupling factor transporter transmembrane protein EcfT [Bacilli bacterium]MDD3304819.1 energy-coupling factor transporter transmembrane protein EcfT [Bacilli bacterium]MDD4053406.1 energy-coupling factor transporter transmembrane protein EcfT [Bacilli bacterium]MDD4410947.1 energy-coupling factor transporter transmembrane protein EcfT [Bacilli bacterium]
MYNTMIGKYIPFNSKIHKMNSTSKIVSVLLFFILLFLDDLLLLVLLTILCFVMMLLTKVPLKLYFKSINVLKILLAFIMVLILAFSSSWYLAITITLKIILGIIYIMILTYTTSKSEITYALERVFKPLSLLKIPVKKMSLSLTLVLRFIPALFEQIEKIMKAQASRGIDFIHTNVKGKMIAISSMIVPIFTLSFKKANATAGVMDVRLYSLNAKRTNYRFNKWSSFDENIVLLHFGLLLYFILRMVIISSDIL